MKKSFVLMMVVLFVAVSVADQALAMGKRGKGSSNSRQNSSVVGSEPQEISVLTEDTDVDSNNQNPNDENDSTPNINDGDSYVEFSQENDEDFPAAAPVPEPATLALMGIGLGGLLLRRKKK